MTEAVDQALVEPCCTTTTKTNNATTLNVDGKGTIVEHESPYGATVAGGETGPGSASLDTTITVTNYTCANGPGTSTGTLTGSVNGDGRVVVIPDKEEDPATLTISAAVDTNIPTVSTYDCGSEHTQTAGPGGGFATQAVVTVPAGWDGLHLQGTATEHLGDFTGLHDRTITWNLTRQARAGCPATSFRTVCTQTLTVSKAGDGSGTIASSDGQLACGTACAANYPTGATVNLTPTPEAGSTFDHWEGACTTSLVPCTVAMDGAKAVTAVFHRVGGDECALYGTGINGCALRPGDILVWRSTAPDIGETFLGDTYWSHSAIVIGYLNMDKSDASRELVIADARPHLGIDEVSLRDITDTAWGNPDADRVSVASVRAYRLEGVSEDVRAMAASKVLGHLLGSGGASRESNQFSSNWRASDFTYAMPPHRGRGETSYNCSGLVSWGFQQVGVNIDGKDDIFNLADHYYVTPDDLISDASLKPRDISGDPTPVTTISLYPPGGASGASGGAAAVETGRRVPAHVVLVDPKGRMTGQTADGRTHRQIPGAVWRLTDHNESVTASGVGTSWKVVVTGKRTGAYRLVVRSLGGPKPSSVVLSDTVARGKARTLAVASIKPGRHCIVPRVRGLTVARARRRIAASHCTARRARRRLHGSGRVVRTQQPRAGTALPRSGRVTLGL